MFRKAAHPEQVGGLQLLGEEVAEEDGDCVQEGDAAEVERIHRQRGGADHVRDLRAQNATFRSSPKVPSQALSASLWKALDGLRTGDASSLLSSMITGCITSTSTDE